MGYCIKYELGIFRQKLVDGWQTEMPDFWLPGGEVWLEPRPHSAVDVHFDGYAPVLGAFKRIGENLMGLVRFFDKE